MERKAEVRSKKTMKFNTDYIDENIKKHTKRVEYKPAAINTTYVFKLLSWASSNIITEYSLSSGLDKLSRSRTPSVRYLSKSHSLRGKQSWKHYLVRRPCIRLKRWASTICRKFTWFLFSPKFCPQTWWHIPLHLQAEHQAPGQLVCAHKKRGAQWTANGAELIPRSLQTELPGNGDGGDTAGLCDSDDAGLGVAMAVEDLGELGALTGPGFSDDHHNGVLLHRLDDLVLELEDWEAHHWNFLHNLSPMYVLPTELLHEFLPWFVLPSLTFWLLGRFR